MAKKRPVVEHITRQLNVRIPTALDNRLGHFLVDTNREKKEVVAEAVDEYLKKRGK